MDVNEELKFLCKFKKINRGSGVGSGSGGSGQGDQGSGRGGGGGSGRIGGFRVDVNEELKFL